MESEKKDQKTENKKEEKAEEKKEEKKEEKVIAQVIKEETAEDLELAEQRKEQQKLFLLYAQFNNPEKLNELVQVVNINCEDENRWTALMHGCAQGHEEIVRILLKRKAVLDPSSILASSLGEDKLDSDFDKETEEKPKQYTPLHWAAHKGHLRVVWLLLLHGYCLTDEDPFGNTPVHQAAAGAATNIIECFLSQGVDIEKKNTRGHTPLDMATDTDTRQLITKAIAVKQCTVCKSKFDFTNVRYYCTKCFTFCCKNCKESMVVYETVESAEKEKPICYCKTCYSDFKNCEKLLDEALSIQVFDRVDVIYKTLEEKKFDADVKKFEKLKEHHTSLKCELEIRHFCQSLEIIPNYKTIKKSTHLLNEMVRNANHKKIKMTVAILTEVNECTKRLNAERNLRLYLDSTPIEGVTEEQRNELAEKITKAKENKVRAEYTDEADIVLDKMTRHIRAKQILERFEAYPVRTYPEPEIIDPKKKKVKKEEKKVVKKKKKKEPPFLIPDWAGDLAEVIKEVDTMNGLIKKPEEAILDKEFLNKVNTQLARFKKEVAYRKQLEAEAKSAAEAKALAKKQKKKK